MDDGGYEIDVEGEENRVQKVETMVEEMREVPMEKVNAVDRVQEEKDATCLACCSREEVASPRMEQPIATEEEIRRERLLIFQENINRDIQ